MFSYTYNVVEKPYIKYWRTSRHGEMQPPVEISLPEPVLVHHFAVTEKYAIIPSMMVFQLSRLLIGKNGVVMAEDKIPRFGILPKYATAATAIKWFDFPGVCCVHCVNAWDDGDEVVIIGSNNTPPSRVLSKPSLVYSYLTKFRMNMKTGRATQTRVSEWKLDVGHLNERYLGRKTSYVHTVTSGSWPKLSGIVKLDLPAGGAPAEVGVRKLPPACYCSEPCFVPRAQGSGADDPQSEDDGYIVSYIHNERTNKSELGIFDARSPILKPVATVKLPSRIPYGAPGIFLSGEQLRIQNNSPADFST